MQKVREIAGLFSEQALRSAKAGVAFVVAAIVAWLAQRGVNVDEATLVSLETGIYGLVTAVWVYIVPNKTK